MLYLALIVCLASCCVVVCCVVVFGVALAHDQGAFRRVVMTLDGVMIMCCAASLCFSWPLFP